MILNKIKAKRKDFVDRVLLLSSLKKEECEMKIKGRAFEHAKFKLRMTYKHLKRSCQKGKESNLVSFFQIPERISGTKAPLSSSCSS